MIHRDRYRNLNKKLKNNPKTEKTPIYRINQSSNCGVSYVKIKKYTGEYHRGIMADTCGNLNINKLLKTLT